MTDPTTPPPLALERSEERREDGRYLIYYTFTETPEEPEAGETPACPS
jgi:hypothetical protein